MLTSKAFVVAATLSAAAATAPVDAHRADACPPGFNDTPALSEHLDQTSVREIPFAGNLGGGSGDFHYHEVNHEEQGPTRLMISMPQMLKACHFRWDLITLATAITPGGSASAAADGQP
jgi:hypothetical protein